MVQAFDVAVLGAQVSQAGVFEGLTLTAAAAVAKAVPSAAGGGG